MNILKRFPPLAHAVDPEPPSTAAPPSMSINWLEPKTMVARPAKIATNPSRPVDDRELTTRTVGGSPANTPSQGAESGIVEP